jgi:hypothetical protein
MIITAYGIQQSKALDRENADGDDYGEQECETAYAIPDSMIGKHLSPIAVNEPKII